VSAGITNVSIGPNDLLEYCPFEIMCTFNEQNTNNYAQVRYLHAAATLMHPNFIGGAHSVPGRKVSFLEQKLHNVAGVQGSIIRRRLVDVVRRIVEYGAHEAVFSRMSRHSESFDDIWPTVLRLRHLAQTKQLRASAMPQMTTSLDNHGQPRQTKDVNTSLEKFK
jgi:hypothetical protein